MKTDVLQFDDLISFHDGRFVKEKVYRAKVGSLNLFCAMWCAWLDKRERWSKWHIRYFFENEKKTYSDFNEFVMHVEDRTLSIIR